MTHQVANLKKKKKNKIKVKDSINYLFINWAIEQKIDGVKTKDKDENGNVVDIIKDNQAVTRIILEGGSRSGKSWAVCCFICEYVIKNEGKVITIYRDFFSNIRNTIYKTLKKVWRMYNLDMNVFNKIPTPININGNEIFFKGAIDAMAAHGDESDLVYFNEIMSIPLYSFDHIEQRIADGGLSLIDYNPTLPEHYVYQLPIDKQTAFISSTWLDNPGISDVGKRKLLSYEPTPENIAKGTANEEKYRVDTLGERGSGGDLVYDNWERFYKLPERYDYRVYGLDFGEVNDPMALVECLVDEDNRSVYVIERLYEVGLSPSQSADRLVEMSLDPENDIICDKNSVALRDYVAKGLNCHPAHKPMVIDRVNELRTWKIYVWFESVNLEHEILSYKFAKNKFTGESSNLPAKKKGEKKLDHLLDALGYAMVYYTEI